MTKKERVDYVLNELDNLYGKEVQKYLLYKNPWELLIAVILSAQCTDARVNLVTRDLFSLYPDPEALGNAGQKDIEKVIHSTGFYTNKAKNIIATSKVIHEEYNDEVPGDIEKLIRLPGVGRKTANVIRGNIFNEPSIVVDTHVKRISGKLGFTKNSDPEKIEFDLMKILPKEHWIRYNTQVIAHGRGVCIANRPRCSECTLYSACPSKG